MPAKFLFLFLLVFAPANAQPEYNYAKVEIFYFDFSINVRVRMTPTDVRDRYLVKLVLRDSQRIAELLRSLPFEELRSLPKQVDADVRLVMDFYTEDGSSETYYASLSHLFDETGRNGADMDPLFAQNFEIGFLVSD